MSGNSSAQGQQFVQGVSATPLSQDKPGLLTNSPSQESRCSSLDFISSILSLPNSCFQKKQSDKLIHFEKFNVWLFQGELVLTENQASEQEVQQGLKFNSLYSGVWKTKGSFFGFQKWSNLTPLAFPTLCAVGKKA